MKNKVRALMRKPLRNPPCHFCHVRAQQEVSSMHPERAPSLEPNHAGTPLEDFQLPELGAINACCFQATPFYGMFVVTAGMD